MHYRYDKCPNRPKKKKIYVYVYISHASANTAMTGENTSARISTRYCTTMHTRTLCTQGGKSVSFASSRALATHARIVRGERSMVKQYVGTNMCPACGVLFSMRLRCIAHATDKRVRVKRAQSCFSLLCTGLFPKVDPATLVELDQQDTRYRREASRAGLTLPRAVARIRRLEDNDDIVHLVKRRRLRFKQASDRLNVHMYLPRRARGLRLACSCQFFTYRHMSSGYHGYRTKTIYI